MLTISGLGIGLSLLLGVIGDLLFGELRRWHPLIGFGNLAHSIERRYNHLRVSKAGGALAWCLAVLPIVLLVQAVLLLMAHWNIWLAFGLHASLLYFCTGLRSLREHTLPIQAALEQGDLAQARTLTSYIVSRDTAQADESYLAKASVESLLENGCDAVFGTFFWFVLLGGAGAVLYRLSNTLDAMWGYRSPRFLHFGCCAARVDDVLNFIPARLTALTYAVLADTRSAWQCWREQAPAWPSPNAGPVMAAGAGALGLALGGSARYDGVDEIRPPLGKGRAAVAADIQRAWWLVSAGSWVWIIVIVLISLICYGGGCA